MITQSDNGCWSIFKTIFYTICCFCLQETAQKKGTYVKGEEDLEQKFKAELNL